VDVISGPGETPWLSQEYLLGAIDDGDGWVADARVVEQTAVT